MAVKATAQITLAVGVDVSSVDNYYKLQASSATPPTKPTTANPTGWSTTEPAYDGTTTNTLYICTKTTLTDNTFYWSAVSVSSSYEAAKQAANAANAAQTGVNNLATYVDVVDARAQAALSQTTSDTGESVTTTNAASAPLRSLAVYGKSVQDGTPTPSAPVAIQSVAAGQLIIEPEAASGWQPQGGSSVAAYTDETVGVCLEFTQAGGGSSYRLQTQSSNFVHVSGTTYALGFWARASASTTIYASCGTSTNTNVNYVNGESVGTDWKYFSGDGTANGAYRLTFWAAAAVTLYIWHPMLVLGTAVAKYATKGNIGIVTSWDGTTTPIDLQGHQLRSLPDGTKDELHVDSAGNVTMLQRCGYVGTDALSAAVNTPVVKGSYVRVPCSRVIEDAPSPPENLSNGYCNIEQFNGDGYNTDTLHCYTHNAIVYLFAPVGDKATWSITTGSEWITEHSVEVVYPLATPQTISLGTIDMPTVEDGDTVEVVGSSVVPSITAEWALPLGYVTSIAEQTQAHFWTDSGGAHVGTVDGKAHVAGAGYNMTLGATGTAVGILLDYNASTLASFTQLSLNFYANGNVVGSYTGSGVAFFDGQGTNANNVTAFFGPSGAQIGALTDVHLYLDNSSFNILNEEDKLLTHFANDGWYRYKPVEQYPDGDTTKPQNPAWDPDNPATLESFIGGYSFELTNVTDKITFGDTSPRYYWNSRAGTSGEWAAVNSRLCIFDVKAPTASTLTLKATDTDSQSAIDIHSDGTIDIASDLYLKVRAFLPNNRAIYWRLADDSANYNGIHLNDYNNLTIGYTGYANSIGDTTIYANTIRFITRGKIGFGASRLPFFKTANTVVAIGNVSAGAGWTKTGITPTAVSGYTCIGIVGVNQTHNQAGTIGGFAFGGSTFAVYGKNSGTGNWTGTNNVTIVGLYVKTELL